MEKHVLSNQIDLSYQNLSLARQMTCLLTNIICRLVYEAINTVRISAVNTFSSGRFGYQAQEVQVSMGFKFKDRLNNKTMIDRQTQSTNRIDRLDQQTKVKKAVMFSAYTA